MKRLSSNNDNWSPTPETLSKPIGALRFAQGEPHAQARGFKVYPLILSCLFILLLGWLNPAFCLPQFEELPEGVVATQTDSSTLEINSSSDKTIINYSSFNILEHESVVFNLPQTSSALLNRVTGNSFSSILGSLSCNGLFILVNPNGINIGPTARIDVGSLIASTRDITDSNFLSSNYLFEKNSDRQKDYLLLNEGVIRIRNPGFAALIAGAIENRGTIAVNMGTIAMGSGDKIKLDILGTSISLIIDQPASAAVFDFNGNQITDQILNTGILQADSGTIFVAAEALTGLFRKIINLEGYVFADSLEGIDGTVKLVSNGSINASVNAPNLEVYKPNAINILASTPLMDRINIEGVDINITYLKSANLTLRTDNDINSLPGVIIQANSLRLIAKKFGTIEVPLEINAINTQIQRVSGPIELLESFGIGSSILLRGPPDGFGAIIYNKETNLILEAQAIRILGVESLHFYGNITFSNFYCDTSNKEIYFEAGYTYTITGTMHIKGTVADDGSINYIRLLSSEKGVRWYIDPQGAHEVSCVYVEDSYNMDPRLIVGESIDHDGNSYNWDADRYSVANGNWDSVNTWSATDGGAPGASVPVAGDNAIINRGWTVTVNIANAACSSIQIGGTTGGSGNGTLTFNAGSQVTVSGTVTIGNGSRRGSINMTNGGTLSAGTFTVNNTAGTWTQGTGTVVLTSTNTLPASWLGPFNNLTINGGTTTLGMTTTVGGTLTMTSGTLDLNGLQLNLSNHLSVSAGTIAIGTGTLAGGTNYNITVNTGATITQGTGTLSCLDFSVTGTGTYTCSGASTLNVAGNVTITSANWTASSSSINMSGAAKTINANQQINNLAIANGASVSILTNHLQIGGTLTVGQGVSGSFDTNSRNLTVTGTTTINAGATLNLDGTTSASTFTTSNTITNSGTFTLENDTNTLSITGSGAVRTFTGNDINYNTNSVTLTSIDYDPDVLLDQAGDTIVLGDSNCSFDAISIGAGGVAATFNAGSYNFTVSGNWTKNAAGTFTCGGTSTVTFAPAGASITITGDTTFVNFTCTSAGKTLNFAALSEQTVSGTWTITGASGNRITLARSGGADPQQWKIKVTGSSNVSFVAVSNSNASGNAITPTGSADGGNNTNWNFPKTTFSGTVYSNEGTTPIGPNITIAIAVDGAPAAATDDTDINSQYSMLIDSPGDGSVVIVYIDGETQVGCTVSVVSSADLAGLNIYQNRVIVRVDYGTTITNANLATADNGDPDIKYAVALGALTVETGQELFVWSGDTFQPGGSVTTPDLDIRGTMTPQANTLNISGNFSNSGTFNPGTSTISFNGTTGTQTVDPGASDLYNVTINNSGTSVQVVNNNVTQTAGGVLAFTQGTLDLNGRTWTLGANFAPTPGNTGAVLNLNTAGSLFTGTNYDINLADKDITITQGVGTITCRDYSHSNGNHTLSGTLNTRNFSHTGSTFTASATTTINVSGNLTISANWTNTGSTVNMTGTAKTIDSNKSFNNLSIADAATISIINNAITIDNALTVGEGVSGSLDTNSRDLTVTGTTTVRTGATLTVKNATFNANTINNSGNILLDGSAALTTITLDSGVTFTNNGTVRVVNDNFTVTLRADGAGQIIFTGNDLDYNTNSITFFGIDYDPDVLLDQAGDAIVLGNALCVFDAISIGAGGVISTFNAGGNNFSMSGNFTNTATGVFTSTATATFNGTAGIQQVSAGGTDGNHDFFNIIINNTGTSVQLQDNLTQAAGGVLTMTAGTLDLNGNTFTLGANLTTAGATIAIGTGILTGATNYSITVNTGATITQGTGTLTCLNLTIQGTGTYTCTGASAINAAGNVVITSANWDDGNSTITMSGAANTINSSQEIYRLTVNNGSSVSLLTNNLTLANNFILGGGVSGTFDTNSLNLTIGGTTTINTGATFNLDGTTAASTLSIANTLTNNGTLTLENDTNTLAIRGTGALRAFTGNDIDYNTNSVTLTNIDYDPDVLLDEAGDTIVLGDANCIFDSISIGVGGVASTFNAGANNFTMSGNFSRNAAGTFISTATITFDGAGTSTISGSTAFFNFTCVTAGKQLTFTAGTTQTVNGALTLTGVAGNRIILRSSITGTQWKIDPAGTRDVSYVDVRDSDNINATMILALKSKDSDNNLNWYFVDYFTITGSASQASGAVNQLTLRAVDGDGIVSTSFDGDWQLTFSGAIGFFNLGPKVADKNGNLIDFGKLTTITFTDGVSTAGGQMILYRAGITYITLDDGIMASDRPLVVEVDPANWVYEPYVQESTISHYTMVKVNEVFLADSFWWMANFTVTIYLDKSLTADQGFDKELLYDESSRQKKRSFPSRLLK
jgi:filamentous hemagglutinin family protein